MKYLIKWFLNNPVVVNLIMIFIIIAGLLSLSNIRIEGFPKIPAESISINISNIGASAEQINQSISQRVDRSLQGLSGVKNITSLSYDDYAEISVQKTNGYDLDVLMNDIKTRVQSISDLPENTKRPIITREEFIFPAMIFQVYGDADREVLQKLGELAHKKLLTQPEINKLSISGILRKEISIELLPTKLEALNLTLNDISSVLSKSNFRYRTGKIKSNLQSITIKANDVMHFAKEFSKIIIKTTPDGSVIYLSDIAKIKDGYVDENILVHYQGKPAIGIEIMMPQKGNIIQISEAAHRVKKQLIKEFPKSVSIDIWTDQSEYIVDRLNLLQSNALYGLIIVFILLALFLNLKVAFWVAIGVPVSLTGTLFVMNIDFIAYPLNDITTFGFILVLGFLVDDAVVVAESIYSEREVNVDPFKETMNGVNRVATATTFGVLTSVAAFFPLLLIDDPIGKVLASFAGIVIIALFFSLLESKFLLPSHLLNIRTENKNILNKYLLIIRKFLNKLLNHFNYFLYKRTLLTFLNYRYAVIFIFISAAIFSFGLVYSGKIHTAFIPAIPGNFISVEMKMDSQSPDEMVLKNAKTLEQNAHKLNQLLVDEGLSANPPIIKIMTAVINSEVQIWAELLPTKEREIKSTTIAKRWRELTENLEGVTKMTFSGTEDIGNGGFQIIINANDKQLLDDSAKDLINTLKNYKGVFDVYNEYQGGSSQIQLKLKSQAQQFGVTKSMLASHIGDSYGGLALPNINHEGKDIDVSLRYPSNWRSSVDKLKNDRIKSTSGQWLPLLSVAELTASYIPSTIMQRNGQRTVIIRASIDKSTTSPIEVYNRLYEDKIIHIHEKNPSVTIKAAGELETAGQLKGKIIIALILAILLIYILLAVPLKSYWLPLIIMSVIPFGFAGAIFGHYLIGIELSVLSFFGMMALTGIVVNDSLVLLTRYNELRQEKIPLEKAIVLAGTSRFRAIFLTTVTTVGGLLPLLSETSEQAQYLIPAAVSLAYGEIFATLITLILIPLLLKVSSDFINE